MRVLLTGASGFTGHYARAALEKAGHQVVILIDGDGSSEVDLTKREKVISATLNAKPDAVIHLAAVAYVAHNDIDAMYLTNIVGTRNLLEALASLPKRPTNVILASSANVYGNSNAVRLDETTTPSPANDYAVSKLAMEYMAEAWVDRLPITIVRPFNYTGVGQSTKFLLPKIVDHFQRRSTQIELGNINIERDFSDVRTIVEVYVRLLDVNRSYRPLNVCSGSSIALTEVIHLMEHIAGHSIEIRRNPSLFRPNEVTKLHGSKSKLESVIGLVENRPLEETLRWMYENPVL
jgi:nucleoside-diphosphate-sugar epimerase